MNKSLLISTILIVSSIMVVSVAKELNIFGEFDFSKKNWYAKNGASARKFTRRFKKI